MVPVSSDGSPSVPPGSGASAAGACSRTAWALVPLMPNAETPARRGRPPSGASHGRACASSRTAPADQSTRLDASWACRVPGSTPFRSASTVLMTPATPAAAWVCPMLDFSDPSHSGRSAGRS